MGYQLETTVAATLPVTVAVAKLHLRIDHSLDDAYITALIEAARAQVEDLYLWWSTTPRTYRMTTDGVAYELDLPMGPVTSITSVSWLDEAGVVTALLAADYRLAWALSGRLEIVDGMIPDDAVQLQVVYVAGPTAPPAFVVPAVLLMVGHWYEHREAVDVRPGAGALEVPMGVRALLLGRRAW